MTWKEAIRDHLRRLWMVYLVGIVALVLVNHLEYTMTRPAYSEDETLKIMLLNVETELDETELLEKIRPLGFEAMEILPLVIDLEAPESEMLLKVQLVVGFADVCITDAQGLAALEAREVCRNVREMSDGTYLIVLGSGMDIMSELATMDILESEWGDG